MTPPSATSGMAEALSINTLRDQRAASCNPVGAPAVTSDLSENVILTTLDDLHNWARLSSLWPLLYGTACCFIEFAALIGSRFDFDRFGLVPRSSPRQADLLIVAGTVTMKMGPATISRSAWRGLERGTRPKRAKSKREPIRAAYSMKQQAVP